MVNQQQKHVYDQNALFQNPIHSPFAETTVDFSTYAGNSGHLMLGSNAVLKTFQEFLDRLRALPRPDHAILLTRLVFNSNIIVV